MNPIGFAHKLVPREQHRINLQTLIAHIEMQPEHCVDMASWIRTDRSGKSPEQMISPACGTVACIGGWGLLAMYLRGLIKINFADHSTRQLLGYRNSWGVILTPIGVQVGEWLGLPEADAGKLFFGEWSTVRHADYEYFTDLSTYSKTEVLNELHYLLETGNV